MNIFNQISVNINKLYPLIVPSNYYLKGTWELPHQTFPNQSFILTWVTFGTSQTMEYLTHSQFLELNKKLIGWQQKSFENLRLSITENENFFTQYKKSIDSEKLIWLCFMNLDGIGSSRILLSLELSKTFPNGYYVAFPDRSCGLIISKDISEIEYKEIKELVANMYKNATVSMSGQIHSPNEFNLPELWTQPIDLQLSNSLRNEIIKLQDI